MKRPDAFRKVRTICQRLDDLSEAQVIEFRARPLKLYLLGSVLTDKADPADVDLVLVYDELSKLLSHVELHEILSYGKPAPFQRLSTHLRRGMKMIRLAPAVDSLAHWPDLCLFPSGEGLHLIWKPGLNWAPILDHLEADPIPWPGPRPEGDLGVVETAFAALPQEEQERQIAQTLATLDEQEKDL